jgi:hypothetical protein
VIEDLGVHQLVPGKAIENEAWLASWPEVPSIDVIRASESRREVLRPGQITDQPKQGSSQLAASMVSQSCCMVGYF